MRGKSQGIIRTGLCRGEISRRRIRRCVQRGQTVILFVVGALTMVIEQVQVIGFATVGVTCGSGGGGGGINLLCLFKMVGYRGCGVGCDGGSRGIVYWLAAATDIETHLPTY